MRARRRQADDLHTDVAKRRARLDADRKAEPLTELRAAVVSGQEGTQFAGPATHLVDRATGERTALTADTDPERSLAAGRKSVGEDAPPSPRDVWVTISSGIVLTAYGSREEAEERHPGAGVRYTLAEPPGEPTAAELDALASALLLGEEGRSSDSTRVQRRATGITLRAWRLGARPKPEGR